MTLEGRIAKNTVILFSSTLISGSFFFAYQIILARYLGAANLGVYSFAFAYVAIFSFLLDGGLGPLMIREISRHKELTARYLVGSLFNKTGLFIVVLTVIILTTSFIQKDGQVRELIYLLIIATFFENLANSFINVFKAYEKMIYAGLYQVVKNLLILNIAFLAYYKGLTVRGVFVLYVLACFLAFIFSVFLYQKKIGLFSKVDTWFSINMLRSSLSFCVYGLLIMYYSKMDTILISFIRSDVDVGYYNAASKLLEMLGTVPGIFLSAVFPSLSVAHISSPDTLQLIFKKVTQLLMVFIIPICIGTAILAKEIIIGLYGSEYLPSSTALSILIWAALFNFMSVSCVNLLNATNNQRKGVFIIMLVAAFNTVMNLILIKKYSYIGASYVMVGSELLSLILSLAFIHYFLVKIDILSLMVKPVVAGVIMGIFTVMMQGNNVLFVIALSACIYIVSLIALKTFSQQDMSLIKEVVALRRR